MSTDLAWMIDGTCREYDLSHWFPDVTWTVRGRRQVTAERASPTAVAVCRLCPVNDECLEYALAHQVDGIWAATTPIDRHRLRKLYGITPAPLIPPSLHDRHHDLHDEGDTAA